MKLLIITQYFPPETGAPQARLSELATRLRKMGHEITVLTSMPNYPTGKIFKSYHNKIKLTENIDNMKVIRTWLYPSNSSRLFPRFFCYFSFALSAILLGIWGIGRHDLVIIESPPLFLVPSGLLISKSAGGKSVMMVADMWPDILIRMGHAKEGWGVKAMLWLEKFCYDHCSAIALTSPGGVDLLQQRFPYLKNITVISNGVDTGMFRPELRSAEVRAELGAQPDDFLVGYCGLHGLAQGLEVVLQAAAQLRDKNNIKFILMGDGPTKEKLQEMASYLKLSNLTFIDRRPKNDMPKILASLDASLAPLSVPIPYAMPSKVYEAWASGVPPIIAKGSECATLVMQKTAGCCYQPGNADDLACVIKQLADNRELWLSMREHCRQLAARFDRDVISRRTEAMLRAIAEDKPLPPVIW